MFNDLTETNRYFRTQAKLSACIAPCAGSLRTVTCGLAGLSLSLHSNLRCSEAARQTVVLIRCSGFQHAPAQAALQKAKSTALPNAYCSCTAGRRCEVLIENHFSSSLASGESGCKDLRREFG